MLELKGFHHLTAVTADAPGNIAFYTRVLGLRLVKKTVNQDDTSAYHLFFADGAATPGTDITFFDWPAAREHRGTNSIVQTGFRVDSVSSIEWWCERLAVEEVTAGEPRERNGHLTLEFQDPEGQRLSLVADGSPSESKPWEKSTVPAEHQVRGLGPITASVQDLDSLHETLTGLMNMSRQGEYRDNDVTVYVYRMSGTSLGSEFHVRHEPAAFPARGGAGGVHHLAFRTPNETDYTRWVERLRDHGLRSSGPVDRFYFRSLYFREPNGILFEIATDGPGFAVDEAMENLGKKLSLPPFLERRRAEIEARLKPLEVQPAGSR